MLDVQFLGVEIDQYDVGRVFPEWVPVETETPVELEGFVVPNPDEDYPGPDVSWQDWPTSHYTHDFNFAVKPSDRFQSLLGIQVTPASVDPCAAERARLTELMAELRNISGAVPGSLGGILEDQVAERIRQWHREHDAEVAALQARLADPACNPTVHTLQQQIVVEWELGLGAGNDGNLLAPENRAGNSGGFYSEGHRRGEVMWQWPTLNDWVHVEGRWVWDRGHPPAVTEIHPPRLVAVKRSLPVFAPLDPCQAQRDRLTQLLADLDQVSGAGIPGSKSEALEDRIAQKVAEWHREHDAEVTQLRDLLSSPACHARLATRVDIFASGDGGALYNNRPRRQPGSPDRTGVPSFVLPVRMSEKDYVFQVRHGLDRPSADAPLGWYQQVHVGDSFPVDARIVGDDAEVGVVTVTIPWQTLAVSDTAVFARTLYLYWDEALGVPEDFPVRAFRVTLDDITIVKTLEFTGEGEYRLFAEVGGNWLLLNELTSADDILDEELGEASECQNFGLNRSFTLLVPSGGQFRLHTSGWEADATDDYFGFVLDSNAPCDYAREWVSNNLATPGFAAGGALDDPAGEINLMYSEACGFGVGRQAAASTGPVSHEDEVASDPRGTYVLTYTIEELEDWRSPR